MRIDVNAFVGAYPFRRVPGTSPDALIAAMDRLGLDRAWMTHLPGVFWRDPAAGNRWLFETASRLPRLLPVPAVHPGIAGWRDAIEAARAAEAPAVRCDPAYYAIDPSSRAMHELAVACAAANLPLALAVRLEDARQRHPNDRAAELPASAIRALVRSDPRLRLLVTHADRPFIEEVHFGSTVEEASRVWWDICWIWGPPEDHLQTLLRTVGHERFVLGTGQPLRLPENADAKLDLLDLTPEHRAAIESGNAETLRAGRPA